MVCLHANASTSGQWRGLIERLSGRYRVLAPDSYGAGKSPDWPSDRVISLQDEAAFVEPVFAAAGTPFTLVGHSYGAAIALRAALDSQLGHMGPVTHPAQVDEAIATFIDAH